MNFDVSPNPFIISFDPHYYLKYVMQGDHEEGEVNEKHVLFDI